MTKDETIKILKRLKRKFDYERRWYERYSERCKNSETKEMYRVNGVQWWNAGDMVQDEIKKLEEP